MAFATYMILKCSLIQLIYIPLAYLLIAFCNNTVEAAAMALLKITSETLYQTLLPCLCVLLITTILAISLAYLSKQFLKKAILLLQNKDYREMAILVCTSIVFCTIVFLVNLYYIRAMSYPLKGMIATLGIFALYVVLTLALTLVMFRLFREKSRMRFEQEHQESLAEYTRQMEAMNAKLRSFKHDYTNILLSIYGYIEDSDMEEIRPIPIQTVDFSRILGIFLDNAMEATELCDTKRIELNLIQNPDSMIFTLRNTFQNTGVSLAQMRKRGFSTKGDSRGLGLANVRELLARYENVENITEIQGDFFVQQLVIQE
ncbi:GHKL domain-containing protein [Anaerosporobacter sp.]|uniref:GHKL domain-containing protein n=1 Tax=Anaerosporobacter sp. TaxID=1872529 RepID=UPI00286F047D|nr:GHKL domain-containing protein [Anaerosporobacter sp.]